jgi:hypothetical protein
MSALPRAAATSCAACWMEFEDESALLQHVAAQHPFSYALPPYLSINQEQVRQISIEGTQKES